MSASTVEETYRRLRRLAESRGWSVPPHSVHMDEPALGMEPWIAYWQACHAHERNPSGGRPIPPHRSGGGQPPNGHHLGPEFFHPEATEVKAKGAPEVPMPEAAPQLQEQPVFELIVPSEIAGVTTPLHHLKFWSDGRVEGLESIVRAKRSVMVINRVPAMLHALFSPMRDYVEDVCSLAENLAGEAATPASQDPAAKQS